MTSAGVTLTLIAERDIARQETQALEARLAHIRNVYAQHRSVDELIMDPLFLVGDAHAVAEYRRLIRDLWVAVKQTVEGEHGDMEK